MKNVFLVCFTFLFITSFSLKAQNTEGKCKSGNCVNGTGKWVTKEYSYEGDFKNGLRDGYGVCRYKSGDIYDGDWKNDMKDGFGIYVYSDKTRFDGDWKENNMIRGKFFNWRGDVVYEGTPGDFQTYNSNQWDKTIAESKAKRESEPVKECVCDKCGGNGKTTFKSAKIWDEPVYKNGDQVGTVRKSGWEYEDVTCTRCLGTGKCK